jgi:hypothetical protein
MKTRSTSALVCSLLFISVIHSGAAVPIFPSRPGNIPGIADVILTVNPQDISFEGTGTDPGVCTGANLVISNCRPLFKRVELEGPLSYTYHLDSLSPVPRHFLISLKENKGKLGLLDSASSVVGYTGNPDALQPPAQGQRPLLSLLEQILLMENSSECALEQSYAISADNVHLPSNDTCWSQLSGRLDSTADLDLVLAYLNIGFITDKSSIAKALQQSDAILYAQNNPSPDRASVLFSIVASSCRLASPETAGDLLRFTSLIKGEDKAYILTAISKYLKASDAPAIAHILSVSNGPMVQYSCMQCLYHIFGEQGKIPTIEVFNADRKMYLDECAVLLKNN